MEDAAKQYLAELRARGYTAEIRTQADGSVVATARKGEGKVHLSRAPNAETAVAGLAELVGDDIPEMKEPN